MRRANLRRHAVALTGAAILALTLSSHAATEFVQPPVDAQALVPPAIRELCFGWIVGPQVTIVGPRVKWTRGVSSDELRRGLTASLQAAVAIHPSALIAADGTWIAFHDPSTASTFALECASELFERIPITGRVQRLAVSPAGDVAMLTQDGVVLSMQPDAQAKGWSRTGKAEVTGIVRAVQTPRLPNGDAIQADDLTWYGRQLMAVGRSRIYRVVPGEKETFVSLVHGESAGTPADKVEHAFTYNGLTYVLRSDGCFDILVGVGMSPHIARVACLPPQHASQSYLTIDEKRITVLGTQNLGAGVPRPSVYTAVLGGDTRQIAQGLSQILTEPWVTTVPIRSTAGQPPNARSTSSLPGETWRPWLAKDMWSTAGEYEATLQAIERLGWTPLSAGSPWNTAPGVAFRWRDSVALHTPAGRTLSRLSRDLYHKGQYDDRQVTSIVVNNRSLSRSLEARLLQQGLAPVAAGYKGVRAAPALLLPVQVRSYLKFFERVNAPDLFNPECLGREGAGNDTFMEAVSNGLPLAGQLEPHVMAALGDPTHIEIRAEHFRTVDCPGAFGSSVATLGVLGGIKLRVTKASGPTFKFGNPVDWADVQLKESGDADWPIMLTKPAVIGYRTPEGDASPAAMTRAWLERLLPHYQGRLAVPVTTLDLAMAIDASVRPEDKARPSMTLMSAEIVPSRVRSAAPAAPCDSADTALKQRREHERSMGLPERASSRREAGLIAVAEDAIDVLNGLFVAPDGRRAWVFPDEHGDFLQVQSLPPHKTLRPLKSLTHGVQVSSLLLAHNTVHGLLHDAQLVWFDLLESDPFVNDALMARLTARGAVINVSQRLLPDDSWEWLRNKVAEDRGQIMLVAAAPNVGEVNPGSPLHWKHDAPVNIIGIGVAKADKSLPDKAPYKRQFVDLLAPGAEVPAFNHSGTLGCIEGTSFATAYATASIAMLARRMNQSAPEVRARLFATAHWLDSYGQQVKAGYIDMGRALDGLNENVVTIDRGSNPPSEITGDINPNARLQFTGTTIVGTLGKTHTKSVPWTDILRLEKRSAVGAPNVYRLHVLLDERYTIYQNVMVGVDAVVGITNCKERKGGTAISCPDLRVTTIKDFVAKVLGPNRVSEFP